MSQIISDPNQSSGALRDTLQANVKILLAARLAVISFFMGMVVFYHAQYGIVEDSLPALIPVAFAYLLTIIYAVAFQILNDLIRFVRVQIYMDLVLVSSIIYCTGGVNSPFSFLFILTIITAAIFLRQAATYITATVASAMYVVLLALEFFGYIRPYYTFPPTYDPTIGGFVLLTGVMRISVFYLIAYLSGYLTYLLRKTDQQLIKKSEDFTVLEAFHKNVVHNMGSGLLAVDMDGVILSHNPAAEKILVLDSERINRKRIEDILTLPNITRFFAYLEQMEGDSRQFDWVYEKDGDQINLNMTVNKFYVDGEIKGAIAVFHYVTEIRKMERQVAKAEHLAAIGRVAAGIAHEIRNPLASLSGSIQMLKSEISPSLDDLGGRLMDIIIRETDRLNRIITEFLGYASPPKVKPARIDISSMMQETIMLLKANPDYSTRITFNDDIEKDIYACADTEQIRQIIWNLCVNAIEAMNGGGALSLKALKTARPYDRRQTPRSSESVPGSEPLDFVQIIVSDTGEGIKPENLSNIFEPFFTTKVNGTGLGLSMVHKIVESHGGIITTVSEAGKGTTFNIWLPMEPDFNGEIMN